MLYGYSLLTVGWTLHAKPYEPLLDQFCIDGKRTGLFPASSSLAKEAYR